MTVAIRQNIPITETWQRNDWANFDALQAISSNTGFGMNGDGGANNFGLNTQLHIDVRSFIEGTWTGGLTTGYQSTLDNWPGASASLSAGLSTFVSQYTEPIDLTVLGTESTLTLALPSLPLSSISPTSSFIDLSSDGFNTQICSLAWSASTTALTAGNSILTFPLSMITGVTTTAVTGVRIRITATGSCTVYMFALRLIGPEWVQTNVDFDSIDGQLRQTIPLDGDTTLVPVPTNQILPQLWRSAATSGSDDPMPIDAEISFLFNTGSQTQFNSFAIYMREQPDAFVTQLDLEGQTQAQLTGHPQPTLVTSTSPSWIKFAVTWGLITSLQLTNSLDPTGGYQFNSGFTFTNNTTYLAICNLNDTSAQMQIYDVNQTTLAIGALVFDTTVIPDPSIFLRQAGRIGFQATIMDGDSYVGAFRPRNLMFAEYRSAALQSMTPVRGARLYVAKSPNIELFSSWSALSDGTNTPLLATDAQRYLQGDANQQSIKVTVVNPSTATPAQGIISNSLSPANDSFSGITDFGEFSLTFSVWMPNAALNSTPITGSSVLGAALISEAGDSIPIILPPLAGGKWQTISIFNPLPTPYPVSGLYQLVLYYLGSVGATFWVDGVSLHEEAISWSARSVTDDPWFSNYAPWTDFHDNLNSDVSGVRLNPMGKNLQMRAQAHKQDAVVLSSPKLVPIYAELGRLIWPEDEPPVSTPPVAIITGRNTGRSYRFNGYDSTSTVGIGDYQWAFGDGTFATGPVVFHTYASWLPSGTDFTVTLTVIDRAAQPGVATELVVLA